MCSFVACIVSLFILLWLMNVALPAHHHYFCFKKMLVFSSVAAVNHLPVHKPKCSLCFTFGPLRSAWIFWDELLNIGKNYLERTVHPCSNTELHLQGLWFCWLPTCESAFESLKTKPTNWPLRQAKIHISLGIRQVLSESCSVAAAGNKINWNLKTFGQQKSTLS